MDVAWPDPDPDGWPTGSASAEVEAHVDTLIADTGRFGTTYAVLVIQGGRVLVERYGGAIPHFDRPDEPVGPTTLSIARREPSGSSPSFERFMRRTKTASSPEMNVGTPHTL